MPDGFAALIVDANAFFTELKQNNNKAWYEPRKAHYVSTIRKPAELLADLIVEDLGRLTGQRHKPKVFRIHRDVRFSKDKAPYNAHLHMMWSQSGSEDGPMWFFGSAPNYLTLGMGVITPPGECLTRFRAFIDRDGDKLTDAMDAAHDMIGAGSGTWGPEPLKRVPKPYDPDHPHGDLLKLKGLTLSASLPDDWRDRGVVPSLNAQFKALLPVWSLLGRI